MIKQLLTISILAFVCAFSITELSAQKKTEEHKIVIIEKEIDDDGNVVEKKIVKEGAEAKAYMQQLEENGETNHKWKTKDGEEIVLDGQSGAMKEKKQYKVRIIDDKGEEKELVWDGIGDMPEEMKVLLEKHDMNISENMDGHNGQKKQKIKIKRKNSSGEEEMEFEYDGDNLPKDIKNTLEEKGIDISEINGEGGEKQIKVIAKGTASDSKKKKAQLGVALDNHPNGVQVAQVIPESSAAEAQIQKGDVIYDIDGNPVTSIEQVVETIGNHKGGDVIKISLERNGEKMTKSVALKAKKDLYPFGTWEDVMNNKSETIEIEVEHEIIKEEKK